MAEDEGATRRRPANVSSTVTVVEDSAKPKQPPTRSPNVVLKLKKPETDKKVKWDQGAVDNEHMNKKKSKCCCIYEKPKVFGESSSDDEDGDDHDCTNHCRGHKKKDYCQLPPKPNPDNESGPSSSPPT